MPPRAVVIGWRHDERRRVNRIDATQEPTGDKLAAVIGGLCPELPRQDLARPLGVIGTGNVFADLTRPNADEIAAIMAVATSEVLPFATTNFRYSDGIDAALHAPTGRGAAPSDASTKALLSAARERPDEAA
jgi:hypothetical protein